MVVVLRYIFRFFHFLMDQTHFHIQVRMELFQTYPPPLSVTSKHGWVTKVRNLRNIQDVIQRKAYEMLLKTI